MSSVSEHDGLRITIGNVVPIKYRPSGRSARNGTGRGDNVMNTEAPTECAQRIKDIFNYLKSGCSVQDDAICWRLTEVAEWSRLQELSIKQKLGGLSERTG